MKMQKIKDELKGMNVQDLIAKVGEYKRELFTLRLNATTAHIKDYSQFKKVRKSLAQAMTFLRQKSS